VTPPAEAAGLQPPHLLTAADDLSGFDCGEPSLDDWLRKRALANQVGGASRTFVATCGGVVVGYYCLAAGSVVRKEAIRDLRHGMPDPVPVAVLGRLAVRRDFAGRGLGRGLLRDAVLRTAQAADTVGVAALVVHALHERVAGFYAGAGFRPSPVAPLTMMVPLQEIVASLRR
jgi:GNAT superfamily N-acetyltransferase